jgi:hypothetical protein
MKLVLLSIAVLAAFGALWILVVVPAERRHHERKLEIVRKRIEQREALRTAPDRKTDSGSAGG